jgi:hypothetical protein
MTKPTFIKILAGCLLGILLFFEPVCLLLMFLLCGVLFFIRKKERAEKLFLTRLIIIALLIRLAFFYITVLFLPVFYIDIRRYPFLSRTVGNVTMLFRDFQREIINGRRINGYLKGAYGDMSLKQVVTYEEGGKRGVFLHFGAYAQGLLNFIFGESVFNLLAYPLVSLWMVLLAYILAKEVFGEEVARIAGAVTTVIPSFVIWSVINIRTTLSAISLLLAAYFLIKFSQRNQPRYLLPIFVAFIMLRFVKEKFIIPMYVAMIATLFYSLKFNLRAKLFVGLPAVTLAIFFLNAHPSIKNKIYSRIASVAITQRAYVYEGGSTYKIYDEYVYQTPDIETLPVSVFIKALPRGIFHFMLVPFPWRITSALRLYFYPQTIFWYMALWLSLVGMLIGLRYRFNSTSIIIIFLAPFVAMMSLALGNEGIAVRHRDLISPFFYIFAAAAICNLFGHLSIDRPLG